jgi:hypothetical protein
MLLENAGRPYSDGACLAMDDPITVKIEDFLNSKEGTKAVIATTAAGLPAIAGIDQTLGQTLGVDYRGHNMKGNLPAGSIAKTGEIFVKAVNR